jgi:hypothetical protein
MEMQTSGVRSIVRLQKPTVEEFNERAVRAGRPALLTGCLDDCGLLASLRSAAQTGAQVDVLSRLIGRRKVHYTAIPPNQGGQLGYGDDGAANFSFSTGKHKVPFRLFADTLRDTLRADGRKGSVYMQSVPIGRVPELAPLVPDVPYLRDGVEDYSQFWVGSGGHVVNLHFDPAHNLVAMLSGRKRFTILPPDNMANLYPAPLDTRLGDTVGSRVTLLDPDLERFPRFETELAKAQAAELEPGDLFYLPPMWWHHVESFGLNVMFNTWILPISGSHFGNLTASLVRGLLLFHDVDARVRADYRPAYAAILTGATPDPAATLAPGTDAGFGARVSRHMAETARVLKDVPACLCETLPQLYDYYLFHVAGPPALARGEPAAFLRKLRWYTRLAAVVDALRRVTTRSARSR